MAKTDIEWATDTENWLAGCTKVSPACQHCYAETMTARQATMPNAPRRYREGVIEDRRWTGRVSYSPAAMFRAFDALERARTPRRVFCNSMSDTFHANVPLESLADLAERIDVWDRCWWRSDTGCERLDAVGEEISTMEMPTRGRRSVIMLLTKRPERMLAWQREHFPDGLPSWVWVGCTVEDQARADARVPVLLEVNAPVRFLSCEPLLGPVDLLTPAFTGAGSFARMEGISWVIAGGESGAKARPSHPDWFRSLRDQCTQAGVPFLFKQWGEWKPISQMSEDETSALYRSRRLAGSDEDQDHLDEVYGRVCTVPELILGTDGVHLPLLHPEAFQAGRRAMHAFRVGKHNAGRHLDGVLHDGYPGQVSGG